MSRQPMCQAPDDSGYKVTATVSISRKGDDAPFVGETRTFVVDTLTQPMARIVLAQATKMLNEGGVDIAMAGEEECGADASMAKALQAKL